MITKVRLFLMFEGKAEEAMNFYVSLIPGGKIIDVVRYRALSDGGAVFMPLGNYGFIRQFAWVNDRFGVSWQLNLD